MRILHISSLIEPLNVNPLGGTEQLVWNLSKLQAADGKTVEVVAVNGSDTAPGVSLAEIDIAPKSVIALKTGPTESPLTEKEIDQRISKEKSAFEPVFDYIRAHAAQIDVIHNHSYDYTPLFGLNELQVPVVHTLHLPPDYPWILKGLREAYVPAQVRYVCVSKTMATAYAEVSDRRIDVVPNWVDCSEIRFSSEPGNSLLWVGRVSPEKGLDRAIRIARMLNTKLVAVGPVYDERYFENFIARELDNPLIEYLGAQPHSAVLEQMQSALALIAPISWEEPFGLVFVEALACGTPVVTCPRGAAVEIIEHGRNGYLAKTDEDFVDYIKLIDQIERKYCREYVESRFSPRISLEKYYRIYDEVAAARPASTH